MISRFSDAVIQFRMFSAMREDCPKPPDQILAGPEPTTGSDEMSVLLASLAPVGCAVDLAPDELGVGPRVRVLTRVGAVPASTAVTGDVAQALLWPVIKAETAYLQVVGFIDEPGSGQDAAEVLMDGAWLQEAELLTAGWWPGGFPGEWGGRVALVAQSGGSGRSLWLGWDLPVNLAPAQMMLFGDKALQALPTVAGPLLPYLGRG